MMRILHCADLHLDASFAASGLSAAAGSWRRVDLRSTLGRIFTLARERQVDAVTIGGDLYQQDCLSPDTADFLVQQLAKLSPIRVFIAPGECDSYTNDSLYALTNWPENVHIFSEGRLSAEELAPGISVWGAACPPARGHEALAKFRVDRDGFNLLLLHASGPEVSGKALFSVDADAVRAAGFDFALLGHCHDGRLWPKDQPYCAYPGSAEPLAPDEASGAHQVVLLTIRDGVCTPETIPISQWRYFPLRLDLTDCGSTAEAAKWLEQLVQANSTGDEERTVCQVTLTGLPGFSLDIEALAKQIETKAYLHYEPQLAFPYNLEQLAQEQTVRGMLVRRLQARIEGASSLRERAKAESALLCALRALDGKQVGFDEIR